MAGGNPEGAGGAHHIQPFELGTGGGSSKNAARPSGVKTIFIVAGRNCLRDLAFHLDSGMVGDEQILPAVACDLRGRQCRRKHANGGMHEQTVYAIFGGSELSIVEVIHMDGDAISEGGEAGRIPYRGPQYRRAAPWGRNKVFQILLNQPPRLSFRSTERQPETIQNRLLAQFHRLGWDIGKLQVHHELRDIGGHFLHLREFRFRGRLSGLHVAEQRFCPAD
jgi:hypothetical protein